MAELGMSFHSQLFEPARNEQQRNGKNTNSKGKQCAQPLPLPQFILILVPCSS